VNDHVQTHEPDIEKRWSSTRNVVHIGEVQPEKTKITVSDYDEQHVHEEEVATVDKCLPFKDEPTVTWVNIDSLHPVEILEEVSDGFELHPLVLEDILNTGQRPERRISATTAISC